jgi:hypothetical protein
MLGGRGMEEVAAEAQAAAYDEFRSPFMELVLFRPETFDKSDLENAKVIT